jgi:hypothetical protein
MSAGAILMSQFVSQEMPTWLKAVSRTVGALDLILSVFGLYLFIDPISRGLLALRETSTDAPYLRTAFVTMILTNGILLLLFGFAAVQLLRMKKSGGTAHASASVLLVVYDLLIRALWATGGRVGMSVAAVIGIGNLGIAPFQCFNLAPYVYPAVSTVLLLVSYRKRAAALQMQSGIA